MEIVRIPFLALLFFVSLSCQPKNTTAKPVLAQKKPAGKILFAQGGAQQYETAYFASGCFWCVEAIFESVKGVGEVYSGYSGGKEENPTYEQVGHGRTSHAEAVEVHYDPKEVDFAQLVRVFFGSHDPTSLNRQGPDRGPQYRSIAFYRNDGQKKVIMDYITLLESRNLYDGRPIVTQVEEFKKFYRAEEYHQDFEQRNPNNPYIRNVSVPRLNRFKANFKSYLKEGLSH